MARRADAAPPASRVAFACGFARRNCPHDVMFQDAYQRTNRTRGTKILRCFPHCCPRHVDRSYCGSSVYLQVDLASGDLDVVDDAALCVFAHFHPKAAPGLVLGQRVARSLFRENQQTDTNATGEWIGARLVASADRTTWMFEVNPSGRWYYQWESGATKAQRATEHVFEAYVLVLDAAFERCEVVAKAVSRDFKMISFRRAPSDPKPSTPEVSIAEVGSPAAFGTREDWESKPTAEEQVVALAASSSSMASRWMQRDSVDSIASSDAEMAARIHLLRDRDSESRTSSPLVDLSRVRLSRASVSSQPTPPSPASASASASASPRPLQSGPFVAREAFRDEPRDDELAPLSFLPPPQIVRISQQLGALVDFVLALPCAALELVSPEIRRGVLGPFSVAGDSRTSGAALAGLIGLPGVDPSARPSASPFPPAVTGVVLRFVLWLLFDREFTHAQEAYLERASAGLLDKVALYESYYAWLERLQHHIDMYLAATHVDLTLHALATDAHGWLRARGSHSVPADAGVSSGTGCRGLESFVAQAREVFLAGDDLRPRRRRRPSGPDQREDETVRSDHQNTFASLSAVWTVDVDSIRWRGVAAAPDRVDPSSPGSSSSPSAFGIMWAWRQVLGLELQIDDDGATTGPATLTVSSLWNPSRRPEASGGETAVRGSRLVLDGKPRWLRVYPSGESTGSVAIGAQRIGHYVASFRPETRELLVNLYSWPTTPTRTQDACCFCSRWCLRLETGDSTLSVRVAVERGRIKRGVDAAELDEKPLTHKVQAVDDWTTTASLQYAYQRRSRTEQSHA